MRVFHPRLWGRVPESSFRSDTFELVLIVPRAGQRRRVYMDRYEKIEEGQQVTCIWTPPYTEVNGWEQQLSEIALSYVVTGIALASLESDEHEYTDQSDNFGEIKRQSLVVDVDVHVAEPLIDTLSTCTPEVEFKLPTGDIYVSGKSQSISLWLVGGNASFANVGEYTYLSTRTGEIVLEALVRRTNDEITLAYHRYSPPFGEAAYILNNILDHEDRAVVEQVISIAEPLEDTYKPYLT